jgi:prepilin signal peptidase PulO-like enzyme (type II secretory pathway)
MSVQTMSASEPPVTKAEETEPQPEAERRSLASLLPSGNTGVLVAVVAGAFVVASFAVFGFHGRAFIGVVLCPALVLLAAIDLKHKLLPNMIILPASLAIGLIVAASAPGDFLSHLAAGAALGGFFFLFGTVFRGSFGMGDAKLGFLLGLALGGKTLGATLIAFAGLFLAAVYVLASRGTSARKDAIPFGPFLAVGGILAYFLGG